MLAHLLTIEAQPPAEAADSFVALPDASATQVLNGQVTTSEWLKAMGAEEPASADPAYEKALAAHAFGEITGLLPKKTKESRKESVLALRTPEAIKKIVGMLTTYEWSFVEHAQQIRAYIVAGLMDETTNGRAEVRLKAYKMLGDVTEVGLFTQRTEIVTKNLTDEQIEQEINRRLERLTINPNTPLVTRVDTEVDDGDIVGSYGE